MTIEDGLYHDIRDHTYNHDRIVAIVMNPGTMYEITRDSIMLSMVRMTGNSIYQFMGIEVRLINEIPDGEWLVVCEDNSWGVYPSDFTPLTFKRNKRVAK